jgi:ankyrin repeat protein
VKKADLNREDKMNYTALDKAIKHKKEEVAAYLHSKGGECKREKY